MSGHFIILLKREISLAVIKSSSILNPLAFFIITVSLFPFALGDQSAILSKLGGGIIWMAALLASMMSFPHLFAEDYEDGSLEQLLLSGVMPSTFIIAKITAQWLVTSLPLIMVSPILAMMLGIEAQKIGLLALSLLAGTPSLTMIGVFTASLTLGIKKSGNVLALIMLPLTVPILIFGALSLAPQETGMDTITISITMLGALLLILSPITIMASSAAIAVSNN